MYKSSITSAIMARLGVALPASPERYARASRRLVWAKRSRLGDLSAIALATEEALRRSLVGGAWSLVVIAVVASLGDAFAGTTNTTIPYSDNFENFTNGTPLLDGTNGWYGNDSNIIVQTNTVRTGTNAAMIPVDCTLSNLFQCIAPTNVWIQMDVRPSLFVGENNPTVDTNAVWMFFINSNGNFVVHNGPTDTPTNSPNWVVTTDGGIATNGTNWVSLQIRANYLNHTWDLYADRILVMNDIGFINSNLTNFAGFDVYNGSATSTSYMDNVSVVLPTVMEVVPAGLTNAVMQGSDATNQVFEVRNTGGQDFNYTVTVTTGTNWITALPLSGTCVPATTNYITNTYTTAGLTNEIFSGEVQVVGMDGWGFIQTNLVGVTMQVVARPVLRSYPFILTQSVAKGANPVNNQFTIWNGSEAPLVPMQYALTFTNGSPSLIQSLSAVSGVSTGQTNWVTINYMDISDAAAGVYTARVHVAAWDAGTTYWPTGTVSLSTTLVVQVEVVALVAPSGVTASDGTYTNKVVVSWNPVADAAQYKAYRSETFDWTQVELIGETVETNFNDLTGVAGVLYYYWVSSVNGHMSEGAMSTNRESGYRGLATPGGIFATDGTYTNRVRVTWPLVDGATGYQLYRGVEGGTLAPIYFTAGGVYEDMTVVGGVHYEYKVGATNGIFGSELSVGDIGYAFGVPWGLSASDGTYVGKVRLMWSGVESASGYEIWRGTQAILSPGTKTAKIATVVTPMYDDTSVEAGVMYYYWVRGEEALTETGDWSNMDRGYAASAGVDLLVKDLVVLPVQVGAGGSPTIVSFRMGNGGGTNMAGANGTVNMEFFASTNQVFGTGGEILIGQLTEEVTLAVGQAMVMKVAGSQLVLPVTEGDYYIFARVSPKYPSLLVDTNPDDNVAKRNGSVRVRSSGGLNYQAFNDYDGDGISDLGVYRGMEWSLRSVDGLMQVTGINVFGGAGRPVLGDLDGDRRADPMVFDSGSGIWQVLFSGSGYMWASEVFGSGGGYQGLVADYEGVGHGEASVFHAAGYGHWYVLNTQGGLIEWNWGTAGYEPVIGDYDGDGHWDLAVYQEATGLWYIRTLNEKLLVSGGRLGGPGFQPLPGDYDGDGYWDAAVYARTTGRWYILSLDGRTLKWDFGGVGPGYEPVFGDYDGDGKWDIGVYQESTGLWYIASLDGRILAWAIRWGGPGYRPIGN